MRRRHVPRKVPPETEHSAAAAAASIDLRRRGLYVLFLMVRYMSVRAVLTGMPAGTVRGEKLACSAGGIWRMRESCSLFQYLPGAGGCGVRAASPRTLLPVGGKAGEGKVLSAAWTGSAPVELLSVAPAYGTVRIMSAMHHRRGRSGALRVLSARRFFRAVCTHRAVHRMGHVLRACFAPDTFFSLFRAGNGSAEVRHGIVPAYISAFHGPAPHTGAGVFVHING